MPTATKRKDTISYYTNTATDRRLYSTTGTVYDIPVEYPKKKIMVRKPVKKAKNINFKRTVFVAIGIILAFTTIFRCNVILKSNQEIRSLEKQYAELLATNQAMQTKLDMAIEMGEIENYAKTELGMISPETNQIFYVGMNMQDKSGDGRGVPETAAAVSGIQGTLVNAFRVLK